MKQLKLGRYLLRFIAIAILIYFTVYIGKTYFEVLR